MQPGGLFLYGQVLKIATETVGKGDEKRPVLRADVYTELGIISAEIWEVEDMAKNVPAQGSFAYFQVSRFGRFFGGKQSVSGVWVKRLPDALADIARESALEKAARA